MFKAKLFLRGKANTRHRLVFLLLRPFDDYFTVRFFFKLGCNENQTVKPTQARHKIRVNADPRWKAGTLFGAFSGPGKRANLDTPTHSLGMGGRGGSGMGSWEVNFAQFLYFAPEIEQTPTSGTCPTPGRRGCSPPLGSPNFFL